MREAAGDVGHGPGDSQPGRVGVGETALALSRALVGVLAGQDAGPERTLGQDAEAQAAGHRDQLPLSEYFVPTTK